MPAARGELLNHPALGGERLIELLVGDRVELQPSAPVGDAPEWRHHIGRITWVEPANVRQGAVARVSIKLDNGDEHCGVPAIWLVRLAD